jgi:hypothetical protein
LSITGEITFLPLIRFHYTVLIRRLMWGGPSIRAGKNFEILGDFHLPIVMTFTFAGPLC